MEAGSQFGFEDSPYRLFLFFCFEDKQANLQPILCWRPTDRPTNRQTDQGIEAPSRSLKITTDMSHTLTRVHRPLRCHWNFWAINMEWILFPVRKNDTRFLENFKLPLYMVWNCTLIHRLQVTVILVGRTVVFAVYNATAKLNQWRYLALNSELPGKIT